MPKRCREISWESGEPLYGTCGEFDTWLFVSWPEAHWHPKSVLNSDEMPAGLPALLGEELKRGRKVSFRMFDDGRGNREGLTVMSWPDGLRKDGVRIGDLTGILKAFFDGNPSGWTPLEGHDIFVCTDGPHDGCCGEPGSRLHEALARGSARRELPVRVWRCSHLGGHKYAPTAIAFPSGHLYGRMDAAGAAEFLDAVVVGRIFVPWYRGTAGRSRDAQIAAYAAASLGLSDKTEEIRIVEVTESRKRLETGRLRVELEKRTYAAPESCSKIGRPQEKIRWAIVSAEKLA